MANEVPSTRRWWSLKEAATYMGCHPNTLYRRVAKAGRKYAAKKTGMPVVRFSRRGGYRFPIDAFKAWVENPTE